MQAKEFASHQGAVASCAGRVAVAVVAGLALACGDDRGRNGWNGTVDTLAGGAVRVRSPAEGAWDSTSAWEVEETLRLGTVQGTGPEAFGNVAAVGVDARGRVYVLDRSRSVVEVFDATGDYVRTLGGEGQGPGELGRPVGLDFGPDGHLWVVDVGNARYTLYDTAGNYRTAYPRRLSGHTLPWRGALAGDGTLYDVTLEVRDGDFRRVLVAYRPSGGELRRVDSTWVPRDPIPRERRQVTITHENGMSAFDIPLAAGLEWWLDPDGSLWLGRSDRYRIVRRELSGDTAMIVERDYERLPVRGDEPRIQRHVERLRERNLPVDRSRIPDRKPAFRSFRADDRGYLWVRVHREGDGRGMPVDVFGPDGRYRGGLRLPFTSLRTTDFRGDTICGISTGELGVERVVCVRIRR